MELQQKRVFGLDFVRSIAIMLVLLAHGLDFFLAPVLKDSSIGRIITKSLNFPLGFFGVEIFFVLSGFLIGRIIIKELVENGKWGRLFSFYIRRWFRTLPLYYLVVFFLVWFPIGADFTWRNLFFVQNFNSNTLSFNPVSWSLSVEEWFYLIIPFIILVAFRMIKEDKGKHFLTICFIIMSVSLLARIILVIMKDPSFDFGVRKQIFYRLDSITAGVILAGIKFYYKDMYKQMIDKRKLLFFISIVGFILCEVWFILHRDMSKLDQSFFSRTIFFNCVTFSCMLLVISLETVKINKVFIRKLIVFISMISYALYLLHFKIYIFARDWIEINSIVEGILLFVGATIITVGFAAFLHKYYELPLMNFRDKIKIFSK
ncbi:acyltransferase family protein [Bacillus sp. R-CC1]